jgi:hypothetical protein
MKTKALAIAALTIITLFTSCEKNTPQNTEIALTQISAQPIAEKKTAPLYVTAASGLSLRQYNNLKSQKLAVMPYGTKVEIVSLELNNTMNISGVKGGMHQVLYNNKTGFAFSGYLSELFPPEPGANPKMYIADLQNTHPTASIKEFTGGTASEPSSTETLLIPTTKWHEAYLIAQKLYDIPRDFAMPDPKGRDAQVINSTNKPLDALVRELQVTRLDNTLVEIVYNYTTTNFKQHLSISTQDGMMKITQHFVVL